MFRRRLSEINAQNKRLREKAESKCVEGGMCVCMYIYIL